MAPAETTVTVTSVNIHRGQGTDGVLDLARVARVMRASGADIADLQEVDRNKRSDWIDQAAELAELLVATSPTSTSIHLTQRNRGDSSAMLSCLVTR